MNDCLPKPIQLNNLKETLNKWISSLPEVETTATIAAVQTGFIDESALQVLKELAPENDSSFMRNLTDKFVINVKKNLLDLNEALNQSNGEKVRQVAHLMKGSCRTMGAQHGANLWETIELEAKGGRLEKVSHLQSQVSDEMTKVFIYFETALIR